MPTSDGTLNAYYAVNADAHEEDSEGRPGVLVLHEAFGLNDDIRPITRRFADNGYAALEPDLYSVGPRLRPLCIRRTMAARHSGEGRAFDDIKASRAWLRDQPEVDESRLAVAGFCMGGGFAILYAARASVGAAADFYGAVPEDSAMLEGICPVIGQCGGRDRMYGSQAERLRGHLEQLGVEHEVSVYPEAGQSFMSEYGRWQSLLVRFGPMSAGGHPPSAESAWTAMLDFFDRQLSG